jgi:Fic-DOC domain mobile mystery protein B
VKFTYPPGATPLDPDEAAGLIPSHIVTQSELNEWEQQNILDAQGWSFSRKNSDILRVEYCRALHKKMFDRTWSWAGLFRKSNKNIGVFWEQVPTQLRLLLDDVQYQRDNATYPLDEIAVRFHHRLAWIHPFPNGNGRHARLTADIFLFNHEKKPFTWGKEALTSYGKTRKYYIEALRRADKGDYESLFKFVRS